MSNYKKLIFLLFIFFSLIFSAVLLGRVRATDTGEVTATVTARNISVSVDNPSVVFGTIGVGSSADTTTNGTHDTTTATNNGNVTEDINIKGADVTAGWTLQAIAGSEQYTMKYCITTCDATPAWVSMSTDYVSLKDDLAKDGTQLFDLQVGTPTITTNFTEQSITITVQATLPD